MDFSHTIHSLRTKLQTLNPLRSLRAKISMSIGLATTALGLILTGVFEQQVTDSVSREAENRVRALSQGVARELSQDLADRQTEVRLIANLLKAGEGLSSTAVQTLLDDLQRSQPAYYYSRSI